jgi:hypothetical protein
VEENQSEKIRNNRSVMPFDVVGLHAYYNDESNERVSFGSGE